jgi:hypothetical protein
MALRPFVSSSGLVGVLSLTRPISSPPPAPAPAQAPSSTSPDRKIDEERAKTTNSENAPIVFPSDLGSNYYISFNAFKHEIEKPEDVRRTFNFKKSINLPLPSNLSDSYSADYNSENLYFIGNAIRQGLTELSSGPGGIVGGLSSIDANSIGRGAASAMDYLKNNKGNLGAAVATLALQGTGGPIGSAAKSSFQVAANPFPVMIFQGTKLKPPFTFDWTLYPESYVEAKTIKTIVGFFRREMLPETFPGNSAILKTPAIFEIVLYPKSPTLRKFKRCVLTNMTVNYSPNGLSFLTDNNGKGATAPVSTSLSLTFQEIEVWLADDYDTNESSSFAPKDDLNS